MAISKTSAVFRKTGDTLDFTPGEDVAEGKIIVERGFVCLAQRAISAGVSGALKILQRGEVVEITTDEAIGETDAGTAVYVVPASGIVTKDADDGEDTPTAYTLLGWTAKAVGADDLTFEVVCA
jgi:predicted RecA/RadA family phage recombinase